jgi:nucleotide-binding universal stress UspA family protein
MFGTILLAVDGSPYAERAAELAQRLAADGDEVVVLHVTEIMPIHGGVSVDVNLDVEGIEAAHRLGRDSEHAGIPTKVELIRIMAGQVAKIIVEVARDREAGVIVLGSRGRGDLSALLLGSVAHKVIHLADRPVLVAR